MALAADLEFADGAVSGVAPYVLGAEEGQLLVLPAGAHWVLVDAAADGVQVTPLTATDFSRPLARVTLRDAAAVELAVAPQRLVDLAATIAAAEAAGLARWALRTAVDYAKVREQFGKPIGSFQAIKHLCAEMLLRTEQSAVAAADAATAADAGDDPQLSIAAAVAAATGIEAAEANVKACIQVLGGIGITWEHDAHLYLRRALGIAQFLGGRRRWLRRIAELTGAGCAGGCASTWSRWPTCVRRSPRRSPRWPRCPPSSARSPWPTPACRRRTGRPPTGATPQPPSSCSSTRNSPRPGWSVPTW